MKVLNSIDVLGYNITFYQKKNGERDFLVNDEIMSITDENWRKVFWYMLREGFLEQHLGNDSLVILLNKLKASNIKRIEELTEKVDLLERLEDLEEDD
jgi:hypothetical protein